MRIEQGTLPNGTELVGIDLRGMVTGDARVTGGASVVHGTVTGDLFVGEESTLELHGVVGGDLVVRGSAVVHGVVNGRGIELGNAVIQVLPGARCQL